MSNRGEFEIGVLAGDGIGAEVSAATCDVLSEAAKVLAGEGCPRKARAG
jgi:isocitrate/isopropylmalate dehydrogenase